MLDLRREEGQRLPGVVAHLSWGSTWLRVSVAFISRVSVCCTSVEKPSPGPSNFRISGMNTWSRRCVTVPRLGKPSWSSMVVTAWSTSHTW